MKNKRRILPLFTARRMSIRGRGSKEQSACFFSIFAELQKRCRERKISGTQSALFTAGRMSIRGRGSKEQSACFFSIFAELQKRCRERKISGTQSALFTARRMSIYSGGFKMAVGLLFAYLCTRGMVIYRIKYL